MVPDNSEKLYLDPIKELDEALEYTWKILCDYYVAGGEHPDFQSMFDGADIAMPRRAAEIVIANMLLEVADGICRFSPWYTKPTRSFGVRLIRDVKTKHLCCKLAPEAVQKWEALIEHLAYSIRQNGGLIKTMLYVESLIGDNSYDENKCVIARCSCYPSSHSIRLNKSALKKMEIYCNVCKQPFV